MKGKTIALRNLRQESMRRHRCPDFDTASAEHPKATKFKGIQQFIGF
jgi:hypothetical protein